ncbi:p-loop containing nucleoside triphosphate hydrolase protein [Favolaschia claudopus]|uniref:P-loop containing nucleoside triphosphate hydrolase protein n=1 Tax=Favolaschia claudopus TaxID=2862362 RepID=A0AAW0C7P1_9AGAR
MDSDSEDELTFLATAGPIDEHTDAKMLRHQLLTSPLTAHAAVKRNPKDFPSRGLIGTSAGERVYFNTNAPSSTVICGVQGSGKSHTVSCILESALITDSRVGKLPEPLSALVFHFDTQDSDRPCEAAFLSTTAPHVNDVLVPRITVLCSPSNVARRRRAYAGLPHVKVEPLCLSEKDFTANRMLAIMGCDNIEKMPLYMHTALLIIRRMGVERFSYQTFKRKLDEEKLDFKQKSMIELRLNLLDAFIKPGARKIDSYFSPGGIVLVDLTDPFLDGVTAALFFDIVLSTFTQWQTGCGKLIVLDEAHKYLTNDDSARLTQSLGNTIRLQRHLGVRIIIATQEPTVVPATILDLTSTIICHRFSSPAWCTHLARHVSVSKRGKNNSDSAADSDEWFEKLMSLPTGHALVFSPAAVIGVKASSGKGGGGAVLLGKGYLQLRVRPRLTSDGGASVLAVSAANSESEESSDSDGSSGSAQQWQTQTSRRRRV